MSAPIKTYKNVDAFIVDNRPNIPVNCVYPHLVRQMARDFLDGFNGTPMYAVKANPSPLVLKELYAAGIRHFDTASMDEIKLINSMFPDATCYFMAPSKFVGAAKEAYEKYGLRHFVADHQSEIDRLLNDTGDDANIFIRLKAHSEEAVYELSSKFGMANEDAVKALQYLESKGRKANISFHVGSLCTHPDAFPRAVANAAGVAKEAGVKLNALDVGGGFPYKYPSMETPPLKDFFDAIDEAVKAADLPKDCEILCEPGRALSANAQSLLLQIIMIKDDQIYLNDGIYGSMSEVGMTDLVRYPYRLVSCDGPRANETKGFGTYGPTCDTLDVMNMHFELPVDVQVGDWIEIGILGAYSNAVASNFNGFSADNWMVVEDDNAFPPTYYHAPV
ncbi:type III PLP-dependent enzyme domain-containing protein [Curvivirga aplysinae]|uniref:type III PLP-dependent enzyme n=1 Tax=Curvivirga aplysinae TaxID=2529852 RepID=UPI0012BCFC39|nr:type III PLP-dependent enzyme [Curvivirga aplysinae]MTI08870.1 type III PLP-dependent enzyme [Curvivirga aplysinae]